MESGYRGINFALRPISFFLWEREKKVPSNQMLLKNNSYQYFMPESRIWASHQHSGDIRVAKSYILCLALVFVLH